MIDFTLFPWTKQHSTFLWASQWICVGSLKLAVYLERCRVVSRAGSISSHWVYMMLSIIELCFHFTKNLPNFTGLGWRFLCLVSVRVNSQWPLQPDWCLAMLFRSSVMNKVSKGSICSGLCFLVAVQLVPQCLNSWSLVRTGSWWLKFLQVFSRALITEHLTAINASVFIALWEKRVFFPHLTEEGTT